MDLPVPLPRGDGLDLCDVGAPTGEAHQTAAAQVAATRDYADGAVGEAHARGLARRLRQRQGALLQPLESPDEAAARRGSCRSEGHREALKSRSLGDGFDGLLRHPRPCWRRSSSISRGSRGGHTARLCALACCLLQLHDTEGSAAVRRVDEEGAAVGVALADGGEGATRRGSGREEGRRAALPDHSVGDERSRRHRLYVDAGERRSARRSSGGGGSEECVDRRGEAAAVVEEDAAAPEGAGAADSGV